MKDATGESVAVRVLGQSGAAEPITLASAATGTRPPPPRRPSPAGRPSSAASGKIISFYGFMKAYVEGSDDPNADLDDNQRRLPPLTERDPLDPRNLQPAEHATRPPARYTEASLIKELEDREIGRPSTYATIIGTILDRGYVFKKGTALVPSFVAFAVSTLLERHFAQLVDYDFTARMEDALDDIANGEAQRVPWLRRFYFGADGEEGLKELVSDLGEIDARDVSSFPLAGTDIVVRVGRYGPYLERDGQRANVPEGTPPDELTPELADELLSRPSGEKILGTDPADRQDDRGQGRPVRPLCHRAARGGRAGLGQAADRLAAEVDGPGQHHAGGRAAPADAAAHARRAGRRAGHGQNGRYGPYVKKGADSRSLESEEQMFTVTLDEAQALFAQPKTRGRQARAAAPPLRELGEDTASGKPIQLKEGRFGPYVTDGETNASLRKGDTVEDITTQRAIELLAERRAAAPSPRRRTSSSSRSSGSGRSAKAKPKSPAKRAGDS